MVASQGTSWVRPAVPQSLFALLILLFTRTESTPCNLNCNGNGYCSTDGVCICLKGFTGPDCSLYACPNGTAWVDLATATDVAHAVDTECSNVGSCDRSNGQCSCQPGFAGEACEKMACPIDPNSKLICSGHGVCMNLEDTSSTNNGITLLKSAAYNLWDARMSHGCVCDYGWSGFRCSERNCPRSDDPTTTGQQTESVHIFCQCAASCSGGITLTFREQTTGIIPYDAPFGFVKGRLEELSTVTSVGVSFDSTNTVLCSGAGVLTTVTFLTESWDIRPVTAVSYLSSTAGTPTLNMRTVQTLSCQCVSCSGRFFLNLNGKITANIKYSATPAQLEAALLALENVDDVTVTSSSTTLCEDTQVTTIITFTGAFGNVPKLIATPFLSGTTVSLVITSDDGTNENSQCSGRGLCDTATGVCVCHTGYENSNGAGETGMIDDCGYQTTGTSTCPSTSVGVCNLQGVCSSDNICECYESYTGAYCNQRSCPKGRAWFVEPDLDNSVHNQYVECSNKGICDRTNGLCSCLEGFGGNACDRVLCPNDCNDNGKCLSMSDLAKYATSNGENLGITYGANGLSEETWDKDQIYGCLCDKGYTGHDCSLQTCPSGDDPHTVGQVNEVQTVSCTADGGTLRLRFRDAVSVEISAVSTVSEFEVALEMLPTIDNVTVTFSGTTLCQMGGSTAEVTFITDKGDLPQLVLHENLLTITTGVTSLSIVETNAGTHENVECSNRGLCDRSSGLCVCFPGFTGSDGNGGYGGRGDCGYPDAHA